MTFPPLRGDITPRLRTSACAGSRIRSALVEFDALSAHSPPFAGVYRVIERPSELVFEALGSVGTVRLEAREAATHMTVSIRCGSREHLEQFLKLGVDVGTARTLDNLVNYLSQQAAPRQGQLNEHSEVHID